jgi:hypothetical protein
MVELDWDDSNKTTLRYTFIDPWTWDEYYATNARRDTFLSEVSHIVDLILDFRRGKYMPSQAIHHIRRAMAWESPQRGIIVIVGVHSMLQALGSVLITLSPQTASKAPRPAKDLEQAQKIIAETRQKREINCST